MGMGLLSGNVEYLETVTDSCNSTHIQDDLHTKEMEQVLLPSSS